MNVLNYLMGQPHKKVSTTGFSMHNLLLFPREVPKEDLNFLNFSQSHSDLKSTSLCMLHKSFNKIYSMNLSVY